MSRLIGICGRKRAGKDVCGSVLEDHFTFHRFAFADPIREILKIMFGWSIEFQMNPETKETIDPNIGISPRKAMQFVGTDFGQWALMERFPLFADIVGRRVWVNCGAREWQIRKENNENLVITDLRFQHEATFIKESGGKIVKIVRPDLQIEDNHESELGVEAIKEDMLIVNAYSSIEEYRYKCIESIDELLKNW